MGTFKRKRTANPPLVESGQLSNPVGAPGGMDNLGILSSKKRNYVQT